MSDEIRSYHFNTKTVQSGKKDARSVRPHIVPIYQTVNFEYADFDEKVRISLEEEPGYLYTRYSNPTIDAFQDAVAVLEEGERAFAFATGMAAITSVMMAILRPGDHVVTSSMLYGGTYQFFEHYLPLHSVDVTFVDIDNPSDVENAFQSNTKVLYLETMINPTVMVSDVPGLSKVAKNHGVQVVVDNTFAPPNLFHPLKVGADVSVHSTTKFMAGHGDTMGGVAVGTSLFIEQLHAVAKIYGGTMSPFNAWLTLRGLKTLALRLERACSNAMALAEFLESHHKVTHVNFPGLSDHPQHDLAKSMLKDYGSMLSFEVQGGYESARKVDDAFKIITSTVSLGEVDTVVAHPASSSHAKMDPEFRRKYGITDGLLRFSVGVEHIDDLKADVAQALEQI